MKPEAAATRIHNAGRLGKPRKPTIGTANITRYVRPRPRLSTCGIGPIRHMFSGRTKASTELVPSINNSAITGAEIVTERPIVFAGLWHPRRIR
jgi:hypothetical protein